MGRTLAKATADIASHEKKVAQLASEGREIHPFPGNQYSVESYVSTPSGSRTILKTGWKLIHRAGNDDLEILVLLSAYFKKKTAIMDTKKFQNGQRKKFATTNR